MSNELWTKKVQPFADAVGKTLEEITGALKSEVGDPGPAALEALASEDYTPFESIKAALSGLNIPPAILRKSVKLLREEKVPVSTASSSMVRMAAVLPSIPDDSSFVEMLKVGGVLKVGITEILSAVKSALADRVGLYDLPSVIKNAMEKQAETLDEPCPKEYYEIRKMVLRKSYSDILSALDIEGGSSFITDSNKTKFLKKLNDLLWQVIYDFHSATIAWNKSWMETAGNPAALATAMASAVSGGGMPAGMMQPPETASLKDSAEAAIQTINKVFAGFGIPLARALAYEAHKVKEILENPQLPALIGVMNRDQMLKTLGVSVAGDYPRLERNIVQYIVALLEYPKVSQDQSEIGYLTAMIQLGNSIPWDKLTGGFQKNNFSGKAQIF